MATAKVEIKLNLTKYTAVLADYIIHAVAVDIRNRAKRTVRKDTGDLRNSVQTEKTAFGYETFSDAPHAAAQEWGRPDLPTYGFTSWARPSAQAASTGAGFNENVQKASVVAANAAKVK
jgi:hypothetical protein